MTNRHKGRDEGFMLIALIVAIFLVLLAMSVAAPRVALALKREREVEAAHRAHQYVRAIRTYYGKFGRYPGSLEQLEKTNNQRFLRQRYFDPFTGEANWKIIHVGEQKTTIKGFFGQDLPGLASGLGGAANLGSAAASASTTGNSSPNTFGSPGPGGAFGPAGGTSGNASAFGPPTANGGNAGGFGSGQAGTGIASQSATSFTGGGGQIMGVGTVHSGATILTVNEQNNYQDWEFLYDPRVEQLRAKVSIFGGGISTGGTSSGFGTTPGTNGFGSAPGAPTSGSPLNPANPTSSPVTQPPLGAATPQ